MPCASNDALPAFALRALARAEKRMACAAWIPHNSPLNPVRGRAVNLTTRKGRVIILSGEELSMVGEFALGTATFVAERLAVTFSELLEELGGSAEQTRKAVKTLAENNWVKIRPLGKDEEIYTITAEGVTELEKRTRKGLAITVR